MEFAFGKRFCFGEIFQSSLSKVKDCRISSLFYHHCRFPSLLHTHRRTECSLTQILCVVIEMYIQLKLMTRLSFHSLFSFLVSSLHSFFSQRRGFSFSIRGFSLSIVIRWILCSCSFLSSFLFFNHHQTKNEKKEAKTKKNWEIKEKICIEL